MDVKWWEEQFRDYIASYKAIKILFDMREIEVLEYERLKHILLKEIIKAMEREIENGNKNDKRTSI